MSRKRDGQVGLVNPFPPRGSLLSPFSTRRLFSREATFSFVGVAYGISKCDADKGKSGFARKKSPSGKRALTSTENCLAL